MNVIELPLTSPPDIARDEFVEVLKMLTHKMSQPLTCLCGSVEVALLGEMDEPECRQVLHETLEQSHRMAEALETLRDLLEVEGLGEDLQLVSWRRSIEDSLEQVAAAKGDSCVQFACDIGDDFWVKASPYHLDAATRRFIADVIKKCHRGEAIRVRLSVFGEAACLSACEEGAPSDMETTPGTAQTHSLGEPAASESLDWWIACHVIERYGGWARWDRSPETGCCYQLNLPLAHANVARRA